MKRFALVALIAGLVIAPGCSQKEVDEYAMITFMLGDVTRNSAAVVIGDIIQEKDIIETAAGSFCDIKIGGSIIRVKENTKLVVSTLLRNGEGEETTLGMDQGKMLCKPKKLLKSDKFVVKTPTAVAGVRGTQFIVEADAAKTTRIKVFDGKVRIAKRVRQLEDSTDRVLEVASDVGKEQKAIITAEEVAEAEKKVEQVLASEAGSGEDAIQAVIDQAREEIVLQKEAIAAFDVEDFEEDNQEMIAVEEKPKEVVNQLARVVKQERKKPKPDGRLLITRYEIYFIKDGNVQWEGKVVQAPVEYNEKLYVASGEYIFCADKSGPVLWRKKIENTGEISIKDNTVVLKGKDTEHTLNAETGEVL